MAESATTTTKSKSSYTSSSESPIFQPELINVPITSEFNPQTELIPPAQSPSILRHPGLGKPPPPLTETSCLKELHALSTNNKLVAYSSGSNNARYLNHHLSVFAFLYSNCENLLKNVVRIFGDDNDKINTPLFNDYVINHFMAYSLRDGDIPKFIKNCITKYHLYEWCLVTSLYIASLCKNDFQFARSMHTCVQTRTPFSMIIKNILFTFYVGLFIQQLLPYVTGVPGLRLICETLLIPVTMGKTLFLNIDLIVQGILSFSLDQLIIAGAKLYGRSTQFVVNTNGIYSMNHDFESVIDRMYRNNESSKLEYTKSIIEEMVNIKETTREINDLLWTLGRAREIVKMEYGLEPGPYHYFTQQQKNTDLSLNNYSAICQYILNISAIKYKSDSWDTEMIVDLAHEWIKLFVVVVMDKYNDNKYNHVKHTLFIDHLSAFLTLLMERVDRTFDQWTVMYSVGQALISLFSGKPYRNYPNQPQCQDIEYTCMNEIREVVDLLDVAFLPMMDARMRLFVLNTLEKNDYDVDRLNSYTFYNQWQKCNPFYPAFVDALKDMQLLSRKHQPPLHNSRLMFEIRALHDDGFLSMLFHLDYPRSDTSYSFAKLFRDIDLPNYIHHRTSGFDRIDDEGRISTEIEILNFQFMQTIGKYARKVVDPYDKYYYGWEYRSFFGMNSNKTQIIALPNVKMTTINEINDSKNSPNIPSKFLLPSTITKNKSVEIYDEKYNSNDSDDKRSTVEENIDVSQRVKTPSESPSTRLQLCKSKIELFLSNQNNEHFVDIGSLPDNFYTNQKYISFPIIKNTNFNSRKSSILFSPSLSTPSWMSSYRSALTPFGSSMTDGSFQRIRRYSYNKMEIRKLTLSGTSPSSQEALVQYQANRTPPPPNHQPCAAISPYPTPDNSLGSLSPTDNFPIFKESYLISIAGARKAMLEFGMFESNNEIHKSQYGTPFTWSVDDPFDYYESEPSSSECSEYRPYRDLSRETKMERETDLVTRKHRYDGLESINKKLNDAIIGKSNIELSIGSLSMENNNLNSSQESTNSNKTVSIGSLSLVGNGINSPSSTNPNTSPNVVPNSTVSRTYVPRNVAINPRPSLLLQSTISPESDNNVNIMGNNSTESENTMTNKENTEK